jgi:hypothetical protein
MEQYIIKGEEVSSYTVEEFIRETRPDGFGHIYFNGEHIAAFEEIICDCCNANIVQPLDKPGELTVFAIPGAAWCRECFERWARP